MKKPLIAFIFSIILLSTSSYASKLEECVASLNKDFSNFLAQSKGKHPSIKEIKNLRGTDPGTIERTCSTSREYYLDHLIEKTELGQIQFDSRSRNYGQNCSVTASIESDNFFKLSFDIPKEQFKQDIEIDINDIKMSPSSFALTMITLENLRQNNGKIVAKDLTLFLDQRTGKLSNVIGTIINNDGKFTFISCH